MSQDSPTPPPAPDPVSTANAQSGSNIATAIANARLNRVSQTTPWGSISYTEGAPGANGVPTWSSQIQLSPQQQALLDQQQGMQLQRNQIAQGYLGQVGRPLDLSNLHPIDMRGQMYSGAVNAAPAASAQSNGPPAANSQQTSELINQILAMLGGSGAAAAPGGSPAAPPAPGASPSGAAPSGAAPPAAASPGATPAPAQSALNFAPTYQDYLNYYGKGGDGALSEQQWNSLGSAGQWHALDDGFHMDQSDPRYAALAKQLGVTNGRMILFGTGNAPLNAQKVNGHTSFVDPTRVLQGNGVWATPHDNLTPQAEFSGGGLSDKGWALAAISTILGGAALGGAMGGVAGAGTGAGIEGGIGTGADIAGTAGAGSAGSAGAAGSVVGNAGMPGYAGAFDTEGVSGLAGSAYDPLAAGTAGAAAGAPVTDLSVQASNPGLFQQAGNNFMNGRGLLGLNGGQRAAVGLLPSLLRAMSTRNAQGGGK